MYGKYPQHLVCIWLWWPYILGWKITRCGIGTRMGKWINIRSKVKEIIIASQI
jgi:hypothetical protein